LAFDRAVGYLGVGNYCFNPTLTCGINLEGEELIEGGELLVKIYNLMGLTLNFSLP